MERTMKLMSAMAVVVLLGACDVSPTVVGPTVAGPAGAVGPADTGNAADIQGTGILATESRDVGGFSRVTLSGVGHLIVEQGATEALTITADDNILPLVTAEVYGDELMLGTLPGTRFASPHNIVYSLTVVDLEALAVLGAAVVEIRRLQTDRFAIRIDGVAVVTATGRADEQDVGLAGVATYDAGGLVSRTVRVEVAGVSRAVVQARETLEGRVEGQSIVEYIGHPVVNVDVTGGASVRPIDG